MLERIFPENISAYFLAYYVFTIDVGRMLRKGARPCFLLPREILALCQGGMSGLIVLRRASLWNQKWVMLCFSGAWGLMHHWIHQVCTVIMIYSITSPWKPMYSFAVCVIYKGNRILVSHIDLADKSYFFWISSQFCCGLAYVFPDHNTRHYLSDAWCMRRLISGGCPVIKGNKWSSTKWIHVDEYKL